MADKLLGRRYSLWSRSISIWMDELYLLRLIAADREKIPPGDSDAIEKWFDEYWQRRSRFVKTGDELHKTIHSIGMDSSDILRVVNCFDAGRSELEELDPIWPDIQVRLQLLAATLKNRAATAAPVRSPQCGLAGGKKRIVTKLAENNAFDQDRAKSASWLVHEVQLSEHTIRKYGGQLVKAGYLKSAAFGGGGFWLTEKGLAFSKPTIGAR